MGVRSTIRCVVFRDAAGAGLDGKRQNGEHERTY